VTEEPDTTEELEESGLVFQMRAGYLLGTVGSIVYRRWAERLAGLKVTPTQAKVLMALGEAGPLGQQRLAELIGVDPRNIVPVAESLVEAGHVSREVDPSDRRRRVLALTSRGHRMAKKLMASTVQNDHELLASLPAADRETLRRLLSAVLHGSSDGR
jgi:DNA-binding MarR family transcriptional regulator